MRTIVHEDRAYPVEEHHYHHADERDESSFLLGLIVVLIIGFLLFYYGLPAIRGAFTTSSGPTINVPKDVNVNVNTPKK